MTHRGKIFIRKIKRRRGPTRVTAEWVAAQRAKQIARVVALYVKEYFPIDSAGATLESQQRQTRTARTDLPRQTGNVIDLASYRLRSKGQPVSYYFVEPPEGHAGFFGFSSLPSVGDRVVLQGRYTYGYIVSSIVHQTSKPESRFKPFIVIYLCHAKKLKRRPLRPK